jgi:hypothetical protein
VEECRSENALHCKEDEEKEVMLDFNVEVSLLAGKQGEGEALSGWACSDVLKCLAVFHTFG